MGLVIQCVFVCELLTFAFFRGPGNSCRSMNVTKLLSYRPELG